MFVRTSYILETSKNNTQDIQCKNTSSDLFLNFIYSSHKCTNLSFGRCPLCLFNCKPRGKIHKQRGIKIMPVHDIQTLEDKTVIGILIKNRGKET